MPAASSPRIYLSYSFADREVVGMLKEALIKSGFQVPIDGGETQLGDPVAGFGYDDIVLAFVSKEALADRTVSGEWENFIDFGGGRLIPLYVPDVLGGDLELPPYLLRLQGVDLSTVGGIERLLASLKQLTEEEPDPSAGEAIADGEPLSAAPRRASFLVRRISLENIRCFENFDLALADDAEPALFTMILGDNAAGKSTLLRSIALGLSSESDASALLKRLPGAFVRRGAEEGSIRLELYDPDNGRQLAITTRILKSGAPDERIRKETEPDPFPWQDIFVCGYGTNRSRLAAASYETYTLHRAVLSLFDDDTVLLNPEVVLLRQESLSPLRTELERRLLRILMLDGPDYEVSSPRTGLEIHGPWGDQPLRALSDGYRSTAQWVLDFLGWSIYAGRLTNGGDVGGILLVDELEQHLHPRWQRHIVRRLHRQFPKTQIFTTSHTPLAAAGTADVDAAVVLRLEVQADGAATGRTLDRLSLAGLRADQVLASEAFGLYTSRNPGSEDDFSRYAELLGKKQRSAAEDAEMERLGASLEATLRTGESEVEREVEQAIEVALKERVAAAQPELVDLEVRRQLHELFAGDNEG